MKRDHRLCHGGGVFRGAFFHGAADLADQNNRLGAFVVIERDQRVARRGADHRIAADADEGRLADAGAGQIEANQRTETAAARDDADRAGPEDIGIMPRHDADEALARRHQPRRVRPDDLRARPPRRKQHRHHVLGRNMFGEHDEKLYAGGDGFERGRLGKRRRNEHDGRIVGRLGHRLGRGRKHRHADMGFAGALRIDAGNDIRAALDHLFGPERALLAGNTGHQHAMGFSVDDHRAASTAACTASSMKS